MSGTVLRVIFVLLVIGWSGFSIFVLVFSGAGDCGDVELCAALQRASAGLAFWRWLAGSLILFSAYRFFRKDEDVL